MDETFTEVLAFVTEICPSCGIPFALEKTFWKNIKRRGDTFYCPSGHAQAYRKSDIDILNDKLKAEAERADWWKEEAERTARSLSATRGHVTRLKNRVASGQCPCCKKSFKSLSKHMANMHPEFVESDAYLEAEPDA